MRTNIILGLMTVLILGLSSFVIGMETDSSISHTDPSGDVVSTGFGDSTPENVDIIFLSIDTSSDTVEVLLEVTGIIVMDADSEYIYNYNILIDQTGDGEEDASIMITQDIAMMYSGFTETSNMEPNVTGAGTSTITISFTRADMGIEDHPVNDIFATAMVADYEMNSATDEINEGFGGGSSGDDDDDTNDPDDADGDDMPDSWEESHGLDTTTDDSMGDKDGDGYSNYEEYIGGTAPDDPSDYPDYYDDDDDRDDESMPDPLKETPTDTTISVSIDDVEMSLDKDDETFEVEQRSTGTTDGEVHHCSMTIVSYYDDGSYDAEEWTVGPEIEERQTFMGITFEMYFKGTGPEGDDDWSAWEMYTYMKAPMSMFEDLMNEFEDDDGNDSDDKEMTDSFLVIRAYSDENGMMWNQESANIKEMYEKFMAGEEFSGSLSGLDGGDGDDKGLPAPGIAILAVVMTAIALVGVVFGYRKR